MCCLKPQLKLEGRVILEGYELALGEEVGIVQSASSPTLGSTSAYTHLSVAGDYLALGTVNQSLSPAILQALQTRMDEIKTILESGNQSQIDTLDRDDVLGNMHYATMLAYYAQYLGQTRMLQQTSNVHEVIVGFGTFGSEVRIDERYGTPTGIKAGGIGLDIPMVSTTVADNNDKQAFQNYRLQVGMIASSLEHQTPEQLYNTDPDNPVQGISTMKAFAIANAEGQKIYTITQDNINDVLPNIQASSLTKSAITNAVNAGKTVTVHEREVSVPGWRGTGYMVIDPVTGDGAYMISGGGNGGWAEIKEEIGYVLDIVKMFAKTVFKRFTDLYDRIIDTIDLINQCEKNIWQATTMLMEVFFLQTIIVLGLVLVLFSPGKIISLGILLVAGKIFTEIISKMEQQCQK